MLKHNKDMFMFKCYEKSISEAQVESWHSLQSHQSAASSLIAHTSYDSILRCHKPGPKVMLSMQFQQLIKTELLKNKDFNMLLNS